MDNYMKLPLAILFAVVAIIAWLNHWYYKALSPEARKAHDDDWEGTMW